MDPGPTMTDNSANQSDVGPSDTVQSGTSLQTTLHDLNHYAVVLTNEGFDRGIEAWADEELAGPSAQPLELVLADPWIEVDCDPVHHYYGEDGKRLQDQSSGVRNGVAETHHEEAQEAPSHPSNDIPYKSNQGAQAFLVVRRPIETNNLEVHDPWSEPSAPAGESSKMEVQPSLDQQNNHHTGINHHSRGGSGVPERRQVLKVEHRITFHLPKFRLSLEKLTRQFLLIYWAVTFPFALIIVWQVIVFSDHYRRPLVRL